MKNTIYKIGFLLLLFVIGISCESPEADINYTPANYEFPSGITLGPGSVNNSSFQFTYSIAGGGTGYYVVVEGGSAAPSSNNVFKGTATGLVQKGNFNLTGAPVTSDVTALCDGTAYDIYAVQMTSDKFLSESPIKLTVSTATNATIAGTYNVVTNGIISGNFDGGDLVDYQGVITITDNGDGTFTFDDISGGYYADPNFYGGFGHGKLKGTFTVPCNDIVANIKSLFYNCCDDIVAFEGIINANGTISVHWENGFGEVMDAVYTKQ